MRKKKKIYVCLSFWDVTKYSSEGRDGCVIIIIIITNLSFQEKW